MLKRASMGIAYNAKPKVQMQAEYRLNQPSLLNVLYLMGFNAEGIKELSS
jgi:phosphoserine phosphatase